MKLYFPDKTTFGNAVLLFQNSQRIPHNEFGIPKDPFSYDAEALSVDIVIRHWKLVHGASDVPCKKPKVTIMPARPQDGEDDANLQARFG